MFTKELEKKGFHCIVSKVILDTVPACVYTGVAVIHNHHFDPMWPWSKQ